MAISSRERNMLLLLAAVAAVFFGSYVLTAMGEWGGQREALIGNLQLAVEREQRLIDDEEALELQRAEVEDREIDMQLDIFSGATIPLIEAAIQQDLSRYARESGLTVNSTRLADRLETEGWLLISQEMSFRTTDANRTVAFLGRLSESQPRLRVTDFSVSRSRTQYSGSITVVGFARPASAAAPF
ncbi:MAG: hypothetical protein F4234_01100 [Gammaproteobacteria bacterium]|nr:hypothetical protein [Gammaproteobacteria bacterium]